MLVISISSPYEHFSQETNEQMHSRNAGKGHDSNQESPDESNTELKKILPNAVVRYGIQIGMNLCI